MKKYLVIDVETTGLPKSWNAPVTDLDNWPRAVQIAWIITDEAGNDLKIVDKIIQPDGFDIPKDATEVHQISTEMAKAKGISLKEVLAELATDLATVNSVVAHNISFDEKVLGAEFLRIIKENPLGKMPTFCTMKEATDFCKIPNKNPRSRSLYKWPSLEELHEKLFNEPFENAHNAAIDVAICKKCFVALKQKMAKP